MLCCYKQVLSLLQVYIHVLNENDNMPLSDEPVYYPVIPEDTPAGRAVVQIQASDQDQDPNQRITYRIISGNPEGFFTINSSTGKFAQTFSSFHYRLECR